MADDETGENTDLQGQLVDIGDTLLYVEERGAGRPLIILHGGPGLDHRMFGDYLDALADNHRLIFVDQRSQGRSEIAPQDTWSLKHMAEDVVKLADALKLVEYAVLGHSYGALVVLQNAVDFPGQAAKSIISSGFPSARFLDHVDKSLKSFEPVELRAQVTASWEKKRRWKLLSKWLNCCRTNCPSTLLIPWALA
ncbi:MAG: alpha/beta fold hydrolase [Chloroflexi bacterium]|nr:alpha/beta fold hydrolase [Chloroflexota bacterium]